MAIDFKRIFKERNIPIRDGGPIWTNTNCPFCKNPPDTHFNGGFNMVSPHFNCWRCGTHSWYDALSKILNIPVSQISSFVKDYKYITNEKPKQFATGHNISLPGFHLNENERKYLENRGYDVDYLINKFHIRGGGIAGEWSYRILIPIYYNKVLVSWTGRSILSREEIKRYNIPRYKNLSIEQSVINPKEIFFNLDNCNGDEVILVEGPMDTLRMSDNCICSLGTSITREQELFLKNRFKKIYIAFDNEPSAQIKAKHLGYNLSSIGLEVEVVNICKNYYNFVFDDRLRDWVKFEKNDPGELNEDEVLEIKEELGLL